MVNSQATPSTPRSQAPIGTCHVRRGVFSRGSLASFQTGTAVTEALATRLQELKHLPALIKARFKTWPDGARPFQLEGMEAQVLGKDVLLHAATGSGKTGIAAGPHLLPCNEGKVTLFVSPLLSLQAEQVCLLHMSLLLHTESS